MCSPSCSPVLSLCVSLCGSVEWAHTHTHRHHLGGVYFERAYSTCTYCVCPGTACVGPALRNVSSRGCRKTWSAMPGMIMRLCICIIVLSQIHEAYLIAATDPITCWLKGQQHWVKRGQERASRDMVSEEKKEKWTTGWEVKLWLSQHDHHGLRHYFLPAGICLFVIAVNSSLKFTAQNSRSRRRCSHGASLFFKSHSQLAH